MSSYQIFRLVLELLSRGDTFAQPIIMKGDNSQHTLKHVSEVTSVFASNFDVVFLDPSGRMNLAGRLTRQSIANV